MNDLDHPSSLVQPAVMDTHKMTGLGHLLKLPTEVRFMVFGDCIAAGYLEFMRASRALQKDGEAIISKKGVYRMHFGSRNDRNGRRPSQEMTKEIRNLDIQVDITNWSSQVHQGWDRLEPFADAQIRREHCNIILKVDCLDNIHEGIELLRISWRFKGFKKVGLRIEADREDLCSCMSMLLEVGVEWMHQFFASMLREADVNKVKDFFCMTFDAGEQDRSIAGDSEEE